MKNRGLLFAFLALFAGVGVAQKPEAKLEIASNVAAPVSLKLGDLKQMPRESFSQPGAAETVYQGVLLADLLKKAGAPMGDALRGKALATYVLASASDGYQVAFSLAELDPAVGSTKVLVADQMNGAPLAESQGPFRLLVETDKIGARSVRMLKKLEIIRLAK